MLTFIYKPSGKNINKIAQRKQEQEVGKGTEGRVYTSFVNFSQL